MKCREKHTGYFVLAYNPKNRWGRFKNQFSLRSILLRRWRCWWSWEWWGWRYCCCCRLSGGWVRVGPSQNEKLSEFSVWFSTLLITEAKVWGWGMCTLFNMWATPFSRMKSDCTIRTPLTKYRPPRIEMLMVVPAFVRYVAPSTRRGR